LPALAIARLDGPDVAAKIWGVIEAKRELRPDSASGCSLNVLEGFYSVFKRGMKGVSSTAQRSTCIAIWRSSISATATALRLA
jgi:hypothetical protein